MFFDDENILKMYMRITIGILLLTYVPIILKQLS